MEVLVRAAESGRRIGYHIRIPDRASHLLAVGQDQARQWLASLHKDFFESGRYGNVRRILDYRPASEYAELRNAVVEETQSAVADELHRYLNFFEFLAGLRKLNQINDAEISGLFDYDLRLIGKHAFVAERLESHGYEQLNALLNDLRITAAR